jgi:hypothetical protein
MPGIIGLVLAVGGGWGAWWLFNETVRDGLSGLVWLVALIICVLGILLIFFQIRKWWMSE